MTDIVDTAFDEFVATGLAPWIVARVGDGAPDAGALRIPWLDGSPAGPNLG